MTTAIGVDLGNTTACVAVNKNAKVKVVANSHGDRLTPAMVTLLQSETLIGFASKQASRRYLQETIRHIKTVLGRHYSDKAIRELVENSGESGLIASEDVGGSLVYSVKNAGNSRTYKAGEITKLILEDIFQTAQSQAGADVNEVVFTAPVGYLSAYRDALMEAALSAGFEVLRVVSEPAAAAIAYGIGMGEAESEPYDIAVFRVGGITQDVTLLEVDNGILSVKKHLAKRNGGDILTDDIAYHFASIVEKEFRTSIRKNAKAMNKLKTQSEICKHVLSTMPSSSCHIDSLYDGMDFNGNISRSRFEMLVSDHLQSLIQPVKELLFDDAVDKERIRKVIMCGGTSNIPRLQTMVSQILPSAEILCSIPPSEVIAIGAATEAGILINVSDTDLADEDCQMTLAPVDIYMKTLDNEDFLIAARTPLPCTVDRDYFVPSSKEECMVQLGFKQNAKKDEGDLALLAELSLDKLSSGDRIMIHLKYLANGHLIFSCTDAETGNSKSLTITS